LSFAYLKLFVLLNISVLNILGVATYFLKYFRPHIILVRKFSVSPTMINLNVPQHFGRSATPVYGRSATVPTSGSSGVAPNTANAALCPTIRTMRVNV